MNKLELLAEEIKNNPIEKGGDIYHPIPFKEFQELSVSSSKKAVEHKWSKIESVIDDIFGKDLNGKKVLDIGANAGFYTYNFSKKGAEVTAFEPHPRYKSLGSQIIEEKNLNIRWQDEMVTSDHPYLQEKYDICLMLSVYQWMAEGGEKSDYAQACLKQVSNQSDYLIFELGFNRGKSHIKTKSLNHYRALIELLQEHTSYKHFKLIGKTRLWRHYKRFLVICSNNPDLTDESIPKILRKINI
jgi:FkbM family methyltransferase